MTAVKAQVCDPDELARRLREGELDALDDLTRCFGQQLMAAGRRYCRTEDEAQDAVQDALVSATEHITQYRGEAAPHRWLVRIIANACSRFRRGRKNDPTLHEPLGPEVGEDFEDPEIIARRAELAEALGEALLELKPEDRTVLILADAEGWTGPEIAEAIQSTPGAVRVRLTRIRQKLRPRLAHLVDTD